MSALNALSGGSASGGSINSARGYSMSTGKSNSQTYGTLATERSKYLAQLANAQSAQAWSNTAQYNSDQAAIQRAWEEYMANTVYQRTVKDMRAAGINPILAAGMGLGTASVGSGATASMSNPEIFMGNSYADQTSASQNQSYSENESHGSSWQNSENGLATGLKLLGDAISGVLSNLNTSNQIDISLQGLENLLKYDDEGGIIPSKRKNGQSNKGKDYFNFDKPINALKSITNYITMKAGGGMITPNKQ